MGVADNTLGVNMTWGTERYVLTSKLAGVLRVMVAVKLPRKAQNVYTHMSI